MHKTIIEPFRIKSVEPLRRTTPEQRDESWSRPVTTCFPFRRRRF